MTNEETISLKEYIHGIVADIVHMDVNACFTNVYDSLNITTGDISPEQHLELHHYQEKIIDLITDIIHQNYK